MDPELTPQQPPPDLPVEPTGVRAAIRDRRPIPHGVLPRHVQTWIMAGLALLIVAVILITGRPEPAPSVSTAPTVSQPGPIQPARVRSYQERLAEQEARLRQEMARIEATPSDPQTFRLTAPVIADPMVDERRRRDEQSLFADNVAFSRRAGSERPIATSPEPMLAPPWPMPMNAPPARATAPPPSTSIPGVADQTAGASAVPPATSSVEARTSSPLPGDPDEPRHTLLEGTMIEAVLVNRLDGTFQAPVQCLVTTSVYSLDRQVVVVPAGARVLGSAAPVQAWGEARLAVRFHRLLMPDGRTHSLDSFIGLNQMGETGLKDQVDRHYLQVFGASLAIGAISGLAQAGTRGGFDPSFGDAARQSAGASLATSTARVLDRYLNVLPTVTIREGHRIKVVLTNDLRLPAYARTRGDETGRHTLTFDARSPVTSGGSR
jgi:type IV secretory pathway VirB10-like protein